MINIFRRRKLNLIRGVSLIEVILALAIFSVIASVMFSSLWGIEHLGLGNEKRIVAHNLAIKRITDTAFDSNSSDPDVWGERIFVGGLESNLTKNNISQCQYVVSSNSKWITGWGSTSTVIFSFIDSDLEIAEHYGLDCGGHPSRFNASGFVPRTPSVSVELENQINSLDLFGGLAYVSLRTDAPDADDLEIIDILENNEIRNTFDTGEIVSKIDIANGNVYVAQNSSTTQLAILETNFETSGPTLSVSATSSLPGVAGARPGAVSIFYFDSRVYVGTKRTAGREFHIFDVSETTQPNWLGSREINHNVNDIQVKDGFAFLATSGNVRDMIVLDIRDPSNVVQIETIDLPGNEDGRTVYVAGNKIYLGRHKGRAPGHDELFVFEFLTNSAGDLEEIVTLGSAPTGADVTDIIVLGSTIFATTENPQSELQIFALSESGELAPVHSKNFSEYTNGIDAEDGIYAISVGKYVHIFNQE